MLAPRTPLLLIAFQVQLKEPTSKSRPARPVLRPAHGSVVPSHILGDPGNTRRHMLVAFGVWPARVCPFSQGHTSSGVQVQGHEVEQVLGGVAHEW
jgi:hypothetical protein